MSDTNVDQQEGPTPLKKPKMTASQDPTSGNSVNTTSEAIETEETIHTTVNTTSQPNDTTSNIKYLSIMDEGLANTTEVVIGGEEVDANVDWLSDQVLDLCRQQLQLMERTNSLLGSIEKHQKLNSENARIISDHLSQLTVENQYNRNHSGRVLHMEGVTIWKTNKINAVHLIAYWYIPDQPLQTTQAKFIAHMDKEEHHFIRTAYCDNIYHFDTKVKQDSARAKNLEELANIWEKPSEDTFSHRFSIRSDKITQFTPLACSCLPYHLEENTQHDNGSLCQSRRLVQKAFISLRDELTRKPLVKIYELTTPDEEEPPIVTL